MYDVEGKTSNWEVVIGLEVHVQISSMTKLFSGGLCEFGAEANSVVSLFDAAMPGVLPVLNFSCVEKLVKAGLALSGTVNLRSVFERKHYFYPDLPHGYQITQNSEPLIIGGHVKLFRNPDRVIRINHIHLEQDAGKSVHDMLDGKTCIDLNRAGVPLAEIVSEADMRSSEEAAEYINRLKLVLQYVGMSGANMEKGELRCDANVSVRKKGESELGVRCEIKNLNSIKNLVAAIDYEAKRQVAVLESGGKIQTETMLFDDHSGETKSLRLKESATDYRYFPDPDLFPLVLDQEYVDNIKSSLPELPDQKEERYINDLGLSPYDADVLVSNFQASDYFDNLVSSGCPPRLAVRWLTVELFGMLKKYGISIADSPVTPARMKELIVLIQSGDISERSAKDVLAKLFNSDMGAAEIVKKEGLTQVKDQSIIREYAVSVLEENPTKVSDYIAGRDKVFAFLVGQVMRKSGGNADPHIVNSVLEEEINKLR